jgi:hypothetical protein
VIVVPHPASGLILHLINRVKQPLGQPVITNGSIEALDIGILLRLSGLNVFDPDSVFAGPGLHSTTDILGAVIAPYHLRFPAPADDLFQRPNQSVCWQREIRFDTQCLPIEVILTRESPRGYLPTKTRFASPISCDISYVFIMPACLALEQGRLPFWNVDGAFGFLGHCATGRRHRAATNSSLFYKM